jgi:hypothetical protein
VLAKGLRGCTSRRPCIYHRNRRRSALCRLLIAGDKSPTAFQPDLTGRPTLCAADTIRPCQRGPDINAGVHEARADAQATGYGHAEDLLPVPSVTTSGRSMTVRSLARRRLQALLAGGLPPLARRGTQGWAAHLGGGAAGGSQPWRGVGDRASFEYGMVDNPHVADF